MHAFISREIQTLVGGRKNLQRLGLPDKAEETTNSCLNDNVEAEYICNMYQTHSYTTIYLSCSINILDK